MAGSYRCGPDAPRDAFDRQAYDRLAAEWRYVITDMICRAGSGHLGGALSLVEIVMTLYGRILRVDPADPAWEDRDRLVLSKGHGAPVLYLALAYGGFFPTSWLGTLNRNGTRLPSHADARSVPGIDMTTGSLGQGLSCACGKALAARLDGREHTVFCILGDGESNEGQIWEAGMFAAQQRLDNLVAICDYNKLQIDGFVQDILGLEPLAEKWRSFNWEVFQMDGHDWDDVYRTLRAAQAVRERPAMVLAHTVKGKGNRAVDNRPESHNIKVPDAAAYRSFMEALEATGFEVPY
ncbi:MAG: transketolase [Lentisphaeria bacterium]|nr:transketolase [Lentisphaeria bacterium]